jgi:hypothetical protein
MKPASNIWHLPLVENPSYRTDERIARPCNNTYHTFIAAPPYQNG